MKNIVIYIFAFLLVGLYSCDTEYLDPFSELEPDVVSSEESLTQLINGLQQRYSTERNGGIYTTLSTTGLNAQELRLLNPGNLGENELLLGGSNVQGNNEVLRNMWSELMLGRGEANLIIANADEAASSAARANTLKAYALLYRALIHGTLIQYFEQLPLGTEVNASFNSRSEVLANVISDLEDAIGFAEQGDASVSASLTSDFDIIDVLNALLARFSLMNGDYQSAIGRAALASLTSRNEWTYSQAFPNPMAFQFGTQNVHQALDQNFGLPEPLQPDAGDQRVAFHTFILDPEAEVPNYQVRSFFESNESPVPIYLPGEMLLIQAEAHARLGNLDEAVGYIDQVRTKTSADDPFGLGAGLTAYSGGMDAASILEEIYRNRRIELYLTGLALEDTKRFSRPNTEFNRVYYPYPNVERDNNTSTPNNPAG